MLHILSISFTNSCLLLVQTRRKRKNQSQAAAQQQQQHQQQQQSHQESYNRYHVNGMSNGVEFHNNTNQMTPVGNASSVIGMHERQDQMMGGQPYGQVTELFCLG